MDPGKEEWLPTVFMETGDCVWAIFGIMANPGLVLLRVIGGLEGLWDIKLWLGISLGGVSSIGTTRDRLRSTMDTVGFFLRPSGRSWASLVTVTLQHVKLLSKLFLKRSPALSQIASISDTEGRQRSALMRADTYLCLLRLCVVGAFPTEALGPVESL
ncbi:hypothetical protein B9Z19DRAFT_1125643 [Tuber borchii]|uniref:Uncharacterized protein n=1 Tax=Tuber borchii TaxID=42251 RepID=A0A2T6ZUJ4_TUBBO|nr:hypothetical protein B9Z19DRAFT_1125643 [Tuber borchii]